MISELSPMLENGPMNECSTLTFFPIMHGPLMVLSVIFASAPVLTLPSIMLFIMIPFMSRLIYSSRMRALADKMSSFLPVSSHHEFKISALTLKPMFIIS